MARKPAARAQVKMMVKKFGWNLMWIFQTSIGRSMNLGRTMFMAGTNRTTPLAKHQLRCSEFLNSFTVIVELFSFWNFTKERKTESDMISVM